MTEAARSEPALCTEPVIGWRSWGLHRRGPDLELTAVIDGHGAWPAREPLVATCRPHARPVGAANHESPGDPCTCGIYASDTLRSLALSGGSFPAVPVVGTVAMWGRVVVHERGFRARFAYPDRLRLVCARCAQRGSGTGIPTRVIEQRTAPGGTGAVVPLCDEHDEIPRTVTTLVRDARAVEAELLGRYAVDLLPYERIASLFEREPVPMPWERPVPVVGSAPAPAPGSGPPVSGIRRRRHPVRTALVTLFLAACAWQYCSSRVVQVPSSATVSRAAAPWSDPWAGLTSTFRTRVRAPHAHPKMPSRMPKEGLAFVCGIPHDDRIELAGCGRTGADLLGLAEDHPTGPCGSMTKAVTRAEHYRICWWWFGYEDVEPHPRAPNPFTAH